MNGQFDVVYYSDIIQTCGTFENEMEENHDDNSETKIKEAE